MKQILFSALTTLIMLSATGVRADAPAPLKEGEAKVSILTDAAGLSLYTFDPDQPGVSNCNGGCAKVWPPLKAPDNTVLEAPLTAIVRADGSKQIAFKGRPLYYYSGDKKPGDINGDDLKDVWYLARP